MAVLAVVVGASPSWAWQLAGLRRARDLAHDGTALYVTGSFPSGPSTTYQHALAVLRIDPATGVETWRYVMDDSSCCDIGWRIVTTASGDVVTGDGIAGFRVIKIAGASGSELWTYDEPQPPGHDVSDLAIDSSDDVIAAGRFGPNPYKFAVLKLSGADGSELWRYVIQGTASSFEVTAHRVAIAANGDVVAAGVLTNAGTGDDFTVVRLDGATGAELWRTDIDGGLSQNDAAFDVGLDAAGDVFVAGVLRTLTGSSAAVKLSGATGMEIWRDDWIDIAGGAELELDSSGAPIVSRNLANKTLAKLDPSTGMPDWTVVAPVFNLSPITADGDVLSASSAAGGAGFGKRAGVDGQTLWTRKVSGGFSGFTEGVIEVGDRVFAALSLDNEAQVVGVAEGLAGKKITFKEKAPTDQKLVLVAKDPLLFAPAIGGPNDPSVGGATLEVRNPDSSETTMLSLPAAGWSAKPGKPTGAVRWKYSNAATGSECLRVGLTGSKKLAIKCRGDLGFSLDEPSQGTLIAILTFAGGHRHCLTFGGDVRLDDPGRFLAKDAPPMVCPD